MRVYYSVDEVPKIKNPVITLGTFDGVHLGHQEVISFLKTSADRVNGETVLFTFHPHPRIVLHPDDHNLELIQSIDKRIQHLDRAGIDHLILYPFTVEFSRQPATEFVRNVLVNKLGIKLMTIGYNHHFGKNREGNIELLRELAPVYNFEVQEIPALRHGELSVNSTKIRRALKDGDITKANAFLGSPFSFEGKVVEGEKIGSKIGFPTANIGKIADTQLLPAIGVYAVKVKLEQGVYSGMMNIGIRPTVSENREKTVEVHMFDFNRQIYGTVIDIYVIAKLRDERSFDSLDALKDQLKKDEINAKDLLDRSPVQL